MDSSFCSSKLWNVLWIFPRVHLFKLDVCFTSEVLFSLWRLIVTITFTHTALTVERTHISWTFPYFKHIRPSPLPAREQLCTLTWGWTWPARSACSQSLPKQQTGRLLLTPCPPRSGREIRWWTLAGWQCRPCRRPAGQIFGQPRLLTPVALRRLWETRFVRSARSCPHRRCERGTAAGPVPLRSFPW